MARTKTSARQLWEAALRDEPGAREALMDRWLPVVTQWCWRLGGPRVDPEDAAHDVLVILITRLDNVQQPERLPAWLFGVTRNVLRKHRTRAWVRRWVPGAGVDRVDPDQDPEARCAEREVAAQVRLVLAELSERDREVLVLFDLEGRTAREVARILGINTNTVKSRLSRARGRFRARAERRGLFRGVHGVIDGGGS